MATFRRAIVPDGTYFFTVALEDRRSNILVRHVDQLRKSYAVAQRRRPFQTLAICILPDHLHAIWTLPEDDADFPTRWSLIKSGFSRAIPASDARSVSMASKREKGLWQRRYWEHVIRDERDMERHINYIHFNPVKHGLTTRVADWPHSSFHRYVERGDLPLDWGGDMRDIGGGMFGE